MITSVQNRILFNLTPLQARTERSFVKHLEEEWCSLCFGKPIYSSTG